MSETDATVVCDELSAISLLTVFGDLWRHQLCQWQDVGRMFGNRYLELATWECSMHVHLTSFPWQRRAEGGKEGRGVVGRGGG